ncbi:DoxX family protein [Flavobacterium silvisoli]|uniref:DoxX family protein n=1 Tax=Flavobacterium silvisoli TaxID=2529433 RepID=A0A4Q9Z5V3_9FLAO|nr:DoxX family protein [Flavobacterium silvisoli]TBX69901.1 DoxX family protein [Flavobacterium silvisoli]
MKKENSIGLFVIRVAIAFPMLVYGISKLINDIGFIKDLLTALGMPSFVAYGVYLGEIVAPIALLVGYRTRLAGLLFALNSLVALLLTQTGAVFTLNAYGGWAVELLALYILVALGLFFTGGGRLAVSSEHRWD